MRLPDWRFWTSLLRPARRAAKPAPDRRRRRVPTVQLSVRQLEERRVLDGALPTALLDATGVLAVSTGTADGSADIIQISRQQESGHDQLEVSVNGQGVYRGDVQGVWAINVAGTSDSDTLIVDFAHGSPIPPGGIHFATGDYSGADALELHGGFVDRILYATSPASVGTLTIQVGSNVGSIDVSGGLQSVTDTMQAGVREFVLPADAAAVRVSGAATQSGRTLVEPAGGPVFAFANPTKMLSISGQADDGTAQAVDVAGLGADFNASLRLQFGVDDAIRFSGTIDLGRGDLDAAAGTIDVSGSIASQGGRLRLDAGSSGTLLVSGSLESTGRLEGEHGGTIDLFGARIGLYGDAAIDASGYSGGGIVRIGGDLHGANPQISNAARVSIGPGASIRADALTAGDGGRVVVWSDEITRFYGEISARGGPLGGNGGLAEVSGLRELAFAGRVDLSAPHGTMGTLWLDPLTIRIKNQNGGTDDGQLAANVPSGGDAAGVILFDDAALGTLSISETALEASIANLILQARNEIVLENLTTDGVLLLAPNVNLTLQTRNDAGAGDSATGGISFENVANRIQTQGSGTITIQAGVTANAAGIVSARQGNADISVGHLQTAGGAIRLEASRNIFAAGTVDSAGGTVTINADSRGIGSGFFFLQPTGSVSTGGSLLTIIGADVALLGTLNSGAGDTNLIATAGGTVRLGLGTADFTLDPLELQRITAANLTIGDTINGDITVNGVTATDMANISGMVTLLATGDGRSVAFGGFPSSFRSLTVRADNGIYVIFGSPVTTVGDLFLDADADNSPDGDDAIHFAVGVTLESAGSITLKATSGGLIGDRALTLNATSGISIQNSLTVPGPGFISINADRDGDGAGTLSLANGVTLDSTDDPLTIVAADLEMNGTSTLNSGAGPTILQTTNGRTMGVGNAAGDWQLSGDELSRISATGLTIGGTTNGDVAIDGVTAAQSAAVGTFAVQATGAGKKIRFEGADSTFATLTASADAGIEFAAGLTLTASAGALQFQSANGELIGAGALTLNAANGIVLNNSLSTAGALNMNADADANGTGVFTIASGKGVSTGNNALSILSADISLFGTLNSGAANTTLTATAGRSVRLGLGTADYTLDNTELQHISAGSLTIGDSTNGDISVVGVNSSDFAGVPGQITLLATGNGRSIAFGGLPSTFPNLTARADNGISIGFGFPSTTVGDLILDADADNAPDGDDAIRFAVGVTLESAGAMSLKAASGGLIGDRALTLKAARGILLENSLTVPGPGFLTINADSDGDGIGSLLLANGITVDSTDDPLTIIAADIDLNATSTLNSGNGPTILQTTSGRTMGVGNAAGSWQLSGDELSRITSNGLTIGGATNGHLEVDGVTLAQSANVGPVTLLATGAGRKVFFTGADSTFPGLSVMADAGIEFFSGMTLTATIGGLQFQTSTGQLLAAGALTLNAANGVSINSPLTTGGALTINADNDTNNTGTFMLAAGQGIVTSGNPLSIVSADVSLSGTLNSDAADVTLRASTLGQIMGIGNAIAPWRLDGTELANISAANLILGGTTNGNIVVDGVNPAQVANISGGVILRALGPGRNITFATNPSTFRTLTAEADNGIQVNLPVNTSVGDLILNGDADDAADGDDAIRFAPFTTISSAGKLQLKSSTGGITGLFALTLNAQNGVQLDSSLSLPGTLSVNADFDANGIGTFGVAAGRTVNTQGNLLSITSADIDLQGALNSGAAETTLSAGSPGRTMAIGNGAGNWRLSGDELQRITAGTLTIGGTTNGDVTIDGITAAQSAGIAGLVQIRATGNGRSLSFSGSASTFRSLTAEADNGILVSTGVTTTVGDLILDGDFDDAFDGADSIQFAGGTLTSANQLILRATTGGLTATGNLVLTANNGVKLEGSLFMTGVGSILINDDADASGTGTFEITDGFTVNSGNNPLTIISADLDLHTTGTLNSGTATTTLRTTNGRTMGIGQGAGQWQLSGAELQRITAGNLIVGNAANGDITTAGVTAAQSANIAGTVTLNANAAGKRLVFEGPNSSFRGLAGNSAGGMTFTAGLTLTATTGDLAFVSTGPLNAAGALTWNAAGTVSLGASLTTAGPLSITADSDGNATGIFVLEAGKSIVSGNNPITIRSADITLAGTLNSGAADTTLIATAGRPVRLGLATADYTLDSSELQHITAANLTIGDSSNGDISVNGVAQNDLAGVPGMVTLLATGNGRSISFGGNSSFFPSLTARADNGIFVAFGPPTTTIGDLILDGDADNAPDGNDAIRFAAGMVLESAGAMRLKAATGGLVGDRALTLNAARGVTLESTLTVPGPGFITINADSNADGIGDFRALDGVDVNSTDDPITITAADLNLSNTGTLTSGSSTTTLLTTNGRTMGVGNAAGQWQLSGSEMQRIVASGLIIGGAANGNVTVDGVTAANSATAGLVTLRATGNGRQILFQGANSVFAALSAQANAGIAFSAGMNLTAVSGGLTFQSTTGGLNGAGALTLNAANTVQLNSSLTTAGPLLVNADADANGTGVFSLANGLAVSTTNNPLTILSADITLLGSLNSGSADTTLAATAGRTVRVGQGTADYTLDSSELQKITAANLTIGDSTNGNISVNGVAAGDLANVAGTVNLLATGNGRSISFIGNVSSFPALTARADNGIQVGFGPPKTTVGDLFFDGDADNSPDGDDAVRFAAGVVLESAGSMRLKATTGGLVGDRALTLRAARGITLDDSLSVPGPGFIDILADTDADGIGNFVLAAGRTVNSFNNPISIVSADINLLGFLNSGTATMLLKPSRTAATIGIEDGTTDFSLDNGELNRIVGTTGVITIGEAANLGGITVGVNGPLALGARNFELVTGSGVLFGANSFTTSGNVTVRADADGNGSGAISNLGGVLSGSSLTLRAAQGISLLVGPGVMDAINTVAGNIDLNSSGAMQVARALQNTAGNVFLTASGSITVLANQPGISALAGEIRLDANGGASDIAVNSLLRTSTMPVALLADRSVTFGSAGSVSTTGGSVTIRADEAGSGSSGSVMMAEGASVESTTGTIEVSAGGDITVGRLQTGNTTAAALKLTTTAGGILDAGDTVGVRNLIANSPGAVLTIESKTGIGATGALEITVDALDVLNAISGPIDLIEADNLAIRRIMQNGAGFVRVTAGGSVTLVNGQAGASSTAGGDINLTAGGNLTVSAPVAAVGGNGSVLLRAGGAMAFNDTGLAADVSTAGTGRIDAETGGALSVGPDVVLRSGTGAVTTRFPALAVVATTVSNVLGADVTLNITYGNVGASNYRVTVNWTDGTVETKSYAAPGSDIFFHRYVANPSALVSISVAVESDPNVQLRGSDLGPRPAAVTAPTSTIQTTTPFDTPTLGNVVQTPIQLPGIIFIVNQSNDSSDSQDANFAFIDTSIGAEQTTLITTAVVVTADVAQQVDLGQTSQNFVLATSETSLIDERQVLLQVLDPRDPGRVVEEVVLREDVLDDLPGFFRRLPDGHYRIQLREPGEKRLRLIIDVEIRQGKPSSGTDEGQDKPPTGETRLQKVAVPVAATPSTTPADEVRPSTEIPPKDWAAGIPEAGVTSGSGRFSVTGNSSNSNADESPLTGTGESAAASADPPAAAVAAAGLVTAGTGNAWRQRIVAALQRSPETEFTKSARLRRRLAGVLRHRKSHSD